MTDPAVHRLDAEIDRRMEYSRPSADTQLKMEEVRGKFIALAHEMALMLPVGREQAMCLTNLELALRDAMAALHHG